MTRPNFDYERSETAFPMSRKDAALLHDLLAPKYETALTKKQRRSGPPAAPCVDFLLEHIALLESGMERCRSVMGAASTDFHRYYITLNPNLISMFLDFATARHNGLRRKVERKFDTSTDAERKLWRELPRLISRLADCLSVHQREWAFTAEEPVHD